MKRLEDTDPEQASEAKPLLEATSSSQADAANSDAATGATEAEQKLNKCGCSTKTNDGAADEKLEKDGNVLESFGASLRAYKPLLLLFVYCTLFALILCDSWEWGEIACTFMTMWMAAVSWLKFLDLEQFTACFSTYHPIAMMCNEFGYVFPFIELAFAVAMAAGEFGLIWKLAMASLYIMDAAGVAWALYNKKSLNCGCMGALALPLSYVTIGEDLLMVLVAATMHSDTGPATSMYMASVTKFITNLLSV